MSIPTGPPDMAGSFSSESTASSESSGAESFGSSQVSSVPHTPVTPTTPIMPINQQKQQHQKHQQGQAPLTLGRKTPMMYSPATSLEAPPIPPRSPGRVISQTQIRMLDRDKRYSNATSVSSTVPPSPSTPLQISMSATESKLDRLQQQLTELQTQAEVQTTGTQSHEPLAETPPAIDRVVLSTSETTAPLHSPASALPMAVSTSSASNASTSAPRVSPLSVNFSRRPPPLSSVSSVAPLTPAIRSAPPTPSTSSSLVEPAIPISENLPNDSSIPSTPSVLAPVAPLAISSVPQTPPALPPKSQHRSHSLKLLASRQLAAVTGSSQNSPSTPTSQTSVGTGNTHNQVFTAALARWVVAIAVVTNNTASSSTPTLETLLPQPNSALSFSEDDTEAICAYALPETGTNLDCTVTSNSAKQPSASGSFSRTSQFHSFRFEPTSATLLPPSRFASALGKSLTTSPIVAQGSFPSTPISEVPPHGGNVTTSNKSKSELHGFALSRSATKDGSVAHESLVILTRLNYPQLFNACLQVITDVIGASDTSAGVEDTKLHILNSAIADIVQWPDPKPNSTLELGFLSTIFTVSIPHHESVPLLGTVELDSSSAHFHSNGRNTHKLYSLSSNFSSASLHTSKQASPGISSSSNLTASVLDTRAAVPADAPVITASEPAGTWDYLVNYISDIADIYLLYEYVLLGKPIVVYAHTPHLVSTFISLLLDLIRPIPYGGRVREYVTPQCPPPDFESGITGITSPFLLESIFGVSLDSSNLNVPGMRQSSTGSQSTARNKNVLLFVLTPNTKLISAQKHAAKLAAAIAADPAPFNTAEIERQSITSPYFYYRTFHNGVGILRRQNNIWSSFANFVMIQSLSSASSAHSTPAGTPRRSHQSSSSSNYRQSSPNPASSPKKGTNTPTSVASYGSSASNSSGLFNKLFSKIGFSKRSGSPGPRSSASSTSSASSASSNQRSTSTTANSSYRTIPVSNPSSSPGSRNSSTPIVTVLEQRPRASPAGSSNGNTSTSSNAALRLQQQNFQQQFQESSQSKFKQQENIDVNARAAMRRSVTYISKSGGRLLVPETKFVAQITQMSASALQLAIPKTIEYLMALKDAHRENVDMEELVRILGTPKTIDFAIRFHFATLTSRFLAPLSCFLEPKGEITMIPEGGNRSSGSNLTPIMSSSLGSSSALSIMSSSGPGSHRRRRRSIESSRRVASGRSLISSGGNTSDFESDAEGVFSQQKSSRGASSSSMATLTGISATAGPAANGTKYGSDANPHSPSIGSSEFPAGGGSPKSPSSNAANRSSSSSPASTSPSLPSSPVSPPPSTTLNERKKASKLAKVPLVGLGTSGVSSVSQSMYNLSLPTINGSTSSVAPGQASKKPSGRAHPKSKTSIPKIGTPKLGGSSKVATPKTSASRLNAAAPSTNGSSPGTPQKSKRYSLPPMLTLTLNNINLEDDDEDYFADLQSYYTPTSGPSSTTASPLGAATADSKSGRTSKDGAHTSFFSTRRFSSHSRNSSSSSSKGSSAASGPTSSSKTNSKTSTSGTTTAATIITTTSTTTAAATTTTTTTSTGSHAVSLLRSLSGRSNRKSGHHTDIKHLVQSPSGEFSLSSATITNASSSLATSPSMITNSTNPSSARSSIISSFAAGPTGGAMEDSRRASGSSKRISLRRVSSIFDYSQSHSAAVAAAEEEKGFDISTALPVTTFTSGPTDGDGHHHHHHHGHNGSGGGEDSDDFKKQEIYKVFMNNSNFANWLKMTHAEVYN